jgi:hypothetical protein
MTILSMDTVGRANQTGFGTATGDPFGTETWVQVRGSMPSGVTGNELTCNSASGGTFNIFRLGSQSPSSVEVLTRINPADTSDIGIVLCYNSTTQFYYMVLSGGNLVIGMDNGGFSTLASATFSYSAGNFYWLRARVQSGTLYLKGWANGSTEPTTWNVTKADSTFSSGGYGLGSDSSSATNTQFDGFVVTDATISVMSESVTLSESITATGAASLTDSVSISEVVTQTGASSTTDSVTVSENVTQTGAASLTDSVSLAESTTQTGTASLSEQVSISEAIAQTGIASNTDTVSLSEAVVLAALGILTLPADVVQLSEVITQLGVVAITDNVLLLESMTGLGIVILASESVHLSENVSASVPAIVSTVYAVGYGRDGYAIGEGA